MTLGLQTSCMLVLIAVCGLGACGGSAGSAVNPQAERANAEAALAQLPQVPAPLAVPSGQALAAYRKGIGVQIYTCAAADEGYAWALKAPRADLYAADKRPAGNHSAGPTWTALDGSAVVGKKLASLPGQPSAVPWLLLGSAAHSGKGLFSNVTYVQRFNTTGGLAPSKSCAADNAGEVVEAAYTADYFFYNPAAHARLELAPQHAARKQSAVRLLRASCIKLFDARVRHSA
jgi:hypothetical protein